VSFSDWLIVRAGGGEGRGDVLKYVCMYVCRREGGREGKLHGVLLYCRKGWGGGWICNQKSPIHKKKKKKG